MPKGKPPSDEERLPWLEPYRDAIAQKQKVARRSHGGLVAVGAAMAVLFAAAGGFWFGRRDAAPPPPPAAEIALAPQVAAPQPQAPAAQAPAAQLGPTPTVETAVPGAKATIIRRKARRAAPVRQRKIRRAGIESERVRAVKVAQERRVARPTVQRAWPRMPSPGPAGQVIQLGAFRTPARAHAAYRLRLARYPLLGRMPRVVVPVISRPRGPILYVLRLGTTSRQQSAVVCRNLRASGDHCLVIG